MRQLRRDAHTPRPRLSGLRGRRTHRLARNLTYDGVDLPDSAFADEPDPAPRPASIAGLPWYWWLTGLALLALLIAAPLFRP